jgi:hypothetical protein
VLADFVILETGGDEKAPIILGRPFLSTTKAIIYADSAKIYFTINGKNKDSISRSVPSTFEFTHRCRTSTRIQSLPQQRRRTKIGEGETKLSIRQKKQYGWSTLLIQNLTTSFYHHTSLS